MSKTVQHIVWNDKVYGDIGEKISGICELEIFYHGGGSETIICQGVYIFEGLGKFVNRVLGIEISRETLGVSGISLKRVGEFVE